MFVMPPSLDVRQSQAGNITLFFLLLIFVILGALSYSLYIGRSVQEKIKISTAADTAALSMANHTATGLNVISINNLAVAGNLHVAAAIPFIGRYYAIANAFLMDVSKTAEMAKLASADSADGSSFGNGFKYTQRITGLLMSAAAGNTFLNRTVAKTWFLKTMPNGVQTARMNAPGALAIPTSLLGVAQANRSALMQVQKLALTNSEDAMCHAVTSSKLSISGDRQSVVFWLRGLTQSVGVTGFLDTALGALGTFEGLVHGLGSILNGEIDNGIDRLNGQVKSLTGGFGCGEFDPEWGIVYHGGQKRKTQAREQVDKYCSDAADLANKKNGQFFPIPTFDSCGLMTAGDFGAQAKAFAGKFGKESDIGFVYPSITSEADLTAFQDSIDHGIVVAMPLFLKDELPTTAGGKATKCPAEWKSTSPGGDSVCDALLGGIDMGMVANSSAPRSYETASGGVGSAMSTSASGDGKLHGLLARTQWAIGEAKAQFRPGDGDPKSATTYSLNPATSRADVYNNTRHQLFWPAWRGVNAPVKALNGVLDFLGKR